MKPCVGQFECPSGQSEQARHTPNRRFGEGSQDPSGLPLSACRRQPLTSVKLCVFATKRFASGRGGKGIVASGVDRIRQPSPPGEEAANVDGDHG